MKNWPNIFSFLFASLLSLTMACTAQSESKSASSETNAESETRSEPDWYTLGKKSRDGIGKYYMEREISHVMGHLGAAWLERPEREKEEKSSLLMANLPIDEDDVIVDIGAGTGYFTFKMAELVPKGKVIAEDIQPEMLTLIKEKKERLGVENIEMIEGTITDPKLPESAVDMVLIVDVYHEFSHPREMMEKIVKSLKPDGKLVLVEYRMEDETVPIKRLHKMSVAQAEREMGAVGLRLIENKSMLPWQHMMIFGK